MMTSTVKGPQVLPATTHSYLLRCADSLGEALEASDAATRYVGAHVAALQAVAAVLAAHPAPAPRPGRRRERNAWVLLTRAVPELGEWAAFFAAGAAKRAAAEAGSSRAVTDRDAAELLHASDHFLRVVENHLGVVEHAPLPEILVTGAVARADVA